MLCILSFFIIVEPVSLSENCSRAITFGWTLIHKPQRGMDISLLILSKAFHLILHYKVFLH